MVNYERDYLMSSPSTGYQGHHHTNTRLTHSQTGFSMYSSQKGASSFLGQSPLSGLLISLALCFYVQLCRLVSSGTKETSRVDGPPRPAIATHGRQLCRCQVSSKPCEVFHVYFSRGPNRRERDTYHAGRVHGLENVICLPNFDASHSCSYESRWHNHKMYSSCRSNKVGASPIRTTRLLFSQWNETGPTNGSEPEAARTSRFQSDRASRLHPFQAFRRFRCHQFWQERRWCLALCRVMLHASRQRLFEIVVPRKFYAELDKVRCDLPEMHRGRSSRAGRQFEWN